jgi:hypothetical protein
LLKLTPPFEVEISNSKNKKLKVFNDFAVSHPSSRLSSTQHHGVTYILSFAHMRATYPAHPILDLTVNKYLASAGSLKTRKDGWIDKYR